MLNCQICSYQTDSPSDRDLGKAHGNTERFKETFFQLWKCPRCQTIYTLGEVDFSDIYKDYPLNKRQLDMFAKGSLGNLLKYLRKFGLKKNHSILDYGCGNGIFVQFLKKHGYLNVRGFDPYVPEFSLEPGNEQFDYVVLNDVIEHSPLPRLLIQDCKNKLKSDGILYIVTVSSGGVEMHNLESHIWALHLPFHRIIMNKKSLEKLCSEQGLELIKSYTRSYIDTLKPFINSRFLEEFNKALGNSLDKAFEPASVKILFKKPILFFYGFFGYLFPTPDKLTVILKKD